jgi:hypothetical protein
MKTSAVVSIIPSVLPDSDIRILKMPAPFRPLLSMQSGIQTLLMTGNSWYDCESTESQRARTCFNASIFPQLEHALAIISRIPDGAISQDIHKQIIKLRKLSVYDWTS